MAKHGKIKRIVFEYEDMVVTHEGRAAQRLFKTINGIKINDIYTYIIDLTKTVEDLRLRIISLESKP